MFLKKVWLQWLQGRIFILDFAYFYESLFLPPDFFSKKRRNIYTDKLIGIYLFYENWSTETFRRLKEEGCLKEWSMILAPRFITWVPPAVYHIKSS
jgi:hypothetical protein